ncbi:MAG: potassium transporter Kup [Gammaproteobacteria bacterium]|nr:potassium transporter Kup [Gammaproteobacteria bacterium]NBT44745.1 potassium transporter Kup [Gammaproteobacteria bacterium]NBY22119.1 potassium transporter Kup [Gammaproteobacteria bacterium]
MNLHHGQPLTSRDSKGLIVAALGVVFGDIGTSPLYTLKECFGGSHPVLPSDENILGILSLVFWSILIVISLKYVAFIMRADNKGEGGIMALLSLVTQKARLGPGLQTFLIGLGLMGASLFYGDGVITPAISVLSAVEGLEVLKPQLHDFIIPIALAVLILLFRSQRHGTGKVGQLFGPIMLLWFLSLAVIGLESLLETPEVLWALDPRRAVEFFSHNGWHGFLTLGAVVLSVTGGEALYADMGHFGRLPIRKAWFFVALPALILNYFGQAALLTRDPEAITSPFYLMVPPAWLSFMIILATLATVIASQAVISGAFSLTAQAIQLGFCPRLTIKYTSEDEMGQIYVPAINTMLMIGVIVLIVGLQSSSKLAAAYGIAVTGTMAIDTILAFVVVLSLWKWNPILSGLVALLFLMVDLAFFGANIPKIPDGGWFPLVIGAVVFLLLSTWKSGRSMLQDKLQEKAMPVEEFLAMMAAHPPVRVSGTAVYLTLSRQGIPLALLNNLRHNKALHDNVIIMSVVTEPLPRVAAEKRRDVQKLADSLFRITLHYGFAESPNIQKALRSSSREITIDPNETYFFMSRETLIAKPSPLMALWRIRLFIGMARNAGSAARYFQIPLDRVVELGTQVMI